MSRSIETIGQLVNLLAKRRKELGISQSELAQLSDLSANGISKFESNKGEREVKVSTLLKLSQCLGFKINLEFEE